MRWRAEQRLCEGLRPGGAAAAEGGDDFMRVRTALQTVRDVVRSAAIVRALVDKTEAKLPSARTRYDEIGIRREAGHVSAVPSEMLAERSVPQPRAIAIHWKRSCAAPHKNIGE